MTLLAIKDLVVRYGEIEAVHGVTLDVDEGQVVTLLGSNGAGKSTTLRAISGLIAPAAGDILFEGKSIAGYSPDAVVRMGISHVPEGRRVFPGLSVRENITLGASNRRGGAGALGREADEMFELFPDIRPFRDALGWTLSGGQQQMVAVARGLMAKPRLVEQNARMGLSVADYGYVLESGRLALGGKPDELWGNEAIRAAYLGGGQAAAARV
jgi:branched-chain amino acid transport system ATP-binding protein